jgi:hypothetical protein
MYFTSRALLILLIAAAACCRSNAQTDEGGPELSFDKTSHDFGKVRTDTVLEYRFSFSNSGKAALVINDISLSCPCFEVSWTRGPVMPGERGEVTVRYPTTAKGGPFDKQLWITSNARNTDPRIGRHELSIRGLVQEHAPAGRKVRREPRIHLADSVFDMGAIPADTKTEFRIKVRNTGSAPLVITRIIGSDGGLLAGYERAPIMPGKSGFISISVVRGPGPFERTFYIFSNAANGNMPGSGITNTVKTFTLKGRAKLQEAVLKRDSVIRK